MGTNYLRSLGIRDIYSGVKLDFTDTVCKNMASICSFKENERELIYAELQKLLTKQVIQKLVTLYKEILSFQVPLLGLNRIVQNGLGSEKSKQICHLQTL